MSKKQEKHKIIENFFQEEEVFNNVQNEPPFMGWPNFDVFWASCVKNGNNHTVKSACIAHLKAIGYWEDQSKWIDGLKHFGIPMEK